MRIGYRFGIRSLLIVVAVLAVAVSYLSAYIRRQPLPQSPYSQQRLTDALGKRQLVLISLSANWDSNSLYNEHFALNSPSVSRLVRAHGIVLLRADWTDFDPVVSQLMRAHGLKTTPAFLIYSPATPDEPRLLLDVVPEKELAAAMRSSIKAQQADPRSKPVPSRWGWR